MKILLILQGPAYGDERSYNGLRLADSLADREGSEVRVFLIGDAVGCALAGQDTPDGYFNLERMIKVLGRRGGEIGCCGTCIDARGITESSLAASARRSSMGELTDWTLWADQVVTF
jgi:uncharacterized protein involved in oxidation of intracellular sulfur